MVTVRRGRANMLDSMILIFKLGTFIASSQALHGRPANRYPSPSPIGCHRRKRSLALLDISPYFCDHDTINSVTLRTISELVRKRGITADHVRRYLHLPGSVTTVNNDVSTSGVRTRVTGQVDISTLELGSLGIAT